MTRKEWQVIYRQYRTACRIAEEHEQSLPPFPLSYKCGWFVRHQCIVKNYTTGNVFSVKDWNTPVDSTDWLSGDKLQNRFVGHYLLIGEALNEK